MKRIVAAFLIMLFIVPLGVSTASAQENEGVFDALAVLKIGSSADGSTVNYFFLRDIMCYRNKEGMYESPLFDGIIFTEMVDVDTPEEAEGFISRLEKEDVFGAIDAAARIFVEDGIFDADIRYPLFVAFPNPNGYFDDETDTQAFCQYYIDTLCSVFAEDKYQYAYLAGIYFDDSYNTMSEVKDYCAGLVEDRGLLAIVGKEYGFCVNVDGVPTSQDPSVLESLILQGEQYSEMGIAVPLMFTFDAFNTAYDLAAALEESIPNENGRQAYEAIRYIVDGKFEDLTDISVYKAPSVSSMDESDASRKEGRDPSDLEYITFAVLAVASLAAFCYIFYALFRKSKKK